MHDNKYNDFTYNRQRINSIEIMSLSVFKLKKSAIARCRQRRDVYVHTMVGHDVMYHGRLISI